MAPRKWAVNGLTFKSKVITTAQGTTISPSNIQPHTTENTGFSLPQGAIASAWPSQRHEDQFLQMLTAWKSRWRINKPNQEQATFDHENVIRKQKALRWLNDQLQAQITALQNNQSSAQSETRSEVSGSPDLWVLDKLIQKWIVEAGMQGHPMPFVAKVFYFTHSEDIQKCEFPRKFLALTFDY